MAVPAPVPALPDTERRKSYAITASVGPLDVGFAVYGDGTDSANWIEVYVNNVLTTAWTPSSPSGALSAIARPITDLQITFNAAQTGTVQIVGARRPRRVAQFTENQGVSARDLNQALTDVVAMQREMWDLSSRVIRGVPGDSFSPLTPAARAGKFIAFDSAGALTLASYNVSAPPIVSLSNCLIFDTRGLAALATIPSSTTSVMTIGFGAVGDFGGATYVKAGASTPGGFQSADGQWWQIVAAGFVTPQMFGAVVNSVAADATNTTAFAAAAAYLLAATSGGTILITPHTFYVSAELALTNNINLVGMNRARSTISTTSLTAHVVHVTGQGCLISTLTILANGITKSAGAGVFLDATIYCGVDNVTMGTYGSLTSAPFSGVSASNSTRFFVRNCTFLNCIGDGLLVSGTSDIYFINGCSVEWQGALGAGGRAGFEVTGNGDCLVTDCQFVGTAFGIALTATAGVTLGEGRFAGCLCDHNSQGLYVNAAGAAAAIGRFTFTHCDFSTPTQAGAQISTSGGGTIKGLSFSQCKFEFSSAGDGLQVLDSGCRDIRVENCLLGGNVGSGIHIFAGVSYFIFIGNMIGAFEYLAGNGTGVLIDAGASDHYIVTNNLVIGNGGQITDNALGANRVVTNNVLV